MINDIIQQAAKEESLKYSIKCQNCGKFISRKSIDSQTAKFHFIPDNQYEPEKSYWECERCS